jgi:thioredoxin 1
MAEQNDWSINVTDKDFFERLQQNPRPVVVDFWAPWCGPCRMIEPALKKVGQEYDDQVDVWKINADEHPELLRQLRIFGIPTLISFRDGQEVARHTGVGSPRDLEGLFEAALSGEPPAPAGITLADRIMRVAIGLALLLLAYTGNFSGIYLLLAALGGVALFSAVYDRCPIWQAVTARFKPPASQEEAEN